MCIWKLYNTYVHARIPQVLRPVLVLEIAKLPGIDWRGGIRRFQCTPVGQVVARYIKQSKSGC